MARSSQCDSIASYMDGIRVKIAEAYKPPRKVDLPTAYTKDMPENFHYDFRFEKSILDKIQEWREVKKATLNSRDTRLESKRKKRIKDTPAVDVENSQSTILTPQPLSPSSNDLQDRIKENGLDYADFDNDTSSPFDNVELKTINDMEELARVLQPDAQCWTERVNLEEDFNELIVEDEEEKLETRRTVADIMQELQKELARPTKENWKSWTYESEEEGKMAKRLNDMGFSMSRSTRAVKQFEGKDNKKIVEFLLAVQSLEDTGIPGDQAEKALILVDYDQERAKIYYENLCILQDLGFPEERASSALLKSNMDRDKALDLLIS